MYDQALIYKKISIIFLYRENNSVQNCVLMAFAYKPTFFK